MAPIIVGGSAPAPAGHYRLILVRQGLARVTADGLERMALPRTVLILPPDADACLTAASGAVTLQVSFCRSLVEPGLLGEDVDRVLRFLRPGPSSSLSVTRLAPEPFSEVAALCARIQGEERDRKPGFRALQALCLVEALVLLSRSAGSSSAPRPPAAGSAEEAVRYAREHFSDDLSLTSLASRFGLNPSYLSRAFSRNTGATFVEFLNRTRVEKSCLLLKRSHMTILEIALWVGYNNISWFNRSFRRVTGMTPREYRNRARR